MFDLSRYMRLITAALAACAVTWALAGSALARPDVAVSSGGPVAPAFKAVAGDVDKAPSSTTARPTTIVVADVDKVPNADQVQRVLNGLGRGKTGPVAAPSVDGSDSTDTVALIVAIAAILMALGAITITITRQQRGPVGV